MKSVLLTGRQAELLIEFIQVQLEEVHESLDTARSDLKDPRFADCYVNVAQEVVELEEYSAEILALQQMLMPE